MNGFEVEEDGTVDKTRKPAQDLPCKALLLVRTVTGTLQPKILKSPCEQEGAGTLGPKAVIQYHYAQHRASLLGILQNTLEYSVTHCPQAL